ncbi:MAG: archease [Anaerolineales bacterium]|nr:archease [Anaerolineales bacterium]
MNKQTTAGYKEVPHTADWELHIWAGDLIGLLVQAAKGMYALADTQLAEGVRLERSFTIEFSDYETLLVRFLSELLYYGEVEQIAFDSFQLAIKDEILHAHLKGAPIVSQVKEIKAVTYHRIEVRETQAGLEVNIVFDV